MKIKKEYHERIITVAHDFLPKGKTHKLGDLKASDIRALYAMGYIADELLEPKKRGLTEADAKADLEGKPRPDNPTKEATKKQKKDAPSNP